jgi:hypothetical protein
MEVELEPDCTFPLLCGTVALRTNHGKGPKDTKLARK